MPQESLKTKRKLLHEAQRGERMLTKGYSGHCTFTIHLVIVLFCFPGTHTAIEIVVNTKEVLTLFLKIFFFMIGFG